MALFQVAKALCIRVVALLSGWESAQDKSGSDMKMAVTRQASASTASTLPGVASP